MGFWNIIKEIFSSEEQSGVNQKNMAVEEQKVNRPYTWRVTEKGMKLINQKNNGAPPLKSGGL